MDKKSKQVADLYVQMLSHLGKQLEAGDIGATELKLIRDLAKDHDIQIDLDEPGNAFDEAFKELPFDSEGNPTEELSEYYK